MEGKAIFAGAAGAHPRAPYRPLVFKDADFAKPLISIVNSWSETSPGHVHLRALAE